MRACLVTFFACSRITDYPEVIPKKCGSVRIGDDYPDSGRSAPGWTGDIGPVLSNHGSAVSWGSSRTSFVESVYSTLRFGGDELPVRRFSDRPSLGFWRFSLMLRGKPEATGLAHPLHLPPNGLGYDKSFRVRR